MKALAVIFGAIILLATMQSSYVMVQARKERKVEAPHSNNHSLHDNGHQDNHHGKQDSHHHTKVKHHENYHDTPGHSKGKDGHGHHHQAEHKVDYQIQPPSSPFDIHYDKVKKDLPRQLHINEIDTDVHESAGKPKAQEEPLQVHISVERISHHNELSKQQEEQKYNLYEPMLGDEPAPETYRGSHHNHGNKKGHKGSKGNHLGKAKGDKQEQTEEGSQKKEKKDRKNKPQPCQHDTDCKAGDCCVELRSREKVCKKGGYKATGRHCINSCVCQKGLECVERHSRRREERVSTVPYLGRCKPSNPLQGVSSPGPSH